MHRPSCRPARALQLPTSTKNPTHRSPHSQCPCSPLLLFSPPLPVLGGMQEEIEGILGARLQDLLNPTQLRVSDHPGIATSAFADVEHVRQAEASEESLV